MLNSGVKVRSAHDLSASLTIGLDFRSSSGPVMSSSCGSWSGWGARSRALWRSSTTWASPGPGNVQAARGQPSSSTMPTSMDAHQDCPEVIGADKRWVGSLVCSVTALASASLLLWLTSIIAG